MLNIFAEALPLTSEGFLIMFLIICDLLWECNRFSRKMPGQVAHEPIKTRTGYALHDSAHLKKDEPASKNSSLLPANALIRYHKSGIKAYTAYCPCKQVV